jgi:beta-galactosidase
LSYTLLFPNFCLTALVHCDLIPGACTCTDTICIIDKHLTMADSSQSRRELLVWALRATTFAGTLPAFSLPAEAPESSARPTCLTRELSLAGEWLFRLDPDGSGEAHNWQKSDISAAGWVPVLVPHTWQVMPGTEEYRGVAWYVRAFEAFEEWGSSAVRIEFEAVFHSTTVWVNGQLAGRHLRKGYTSFTLDITSLLRPNVHNVIVVKVDSSFDEAMLPRGRSSDWAHDGGIYRPVRLLITSPVFIERLAVDAVPHLLSGAVGAADYASVEVSTTVHNVTAKSWQGQLGYRIEEDETGRCVLEKQGAASVTLQPGESRSVTLTAGTIPEPRLWHFDHPHLYTLKVTLSQTPHVFHELNTRVGIRSIEVRNGGIYLNGEKVRLMGVERMAGSNPEFGMAEPTGWITHDHDDLKNLNSVLTRVHWQQDRRVLDYCDRYGILLQCEVPAWGYDTFGNDAHPRPEIMQNGFEQLQEMIERDCNHPSIISWGLCNEVDGQNPPAYEFAQRLYAEAKKLDPRRLCSYASNSLEKTPGKDVSGLMDFVECNEYFESWAEGTPEDLRRSLQEIHRAFPEKPIVISEYGYCACVPERPEGDARRTEVLRDHTRVCRELDFVAGLIFFSYNDYRTHVGDKGVATTKQRVHGVVDLYGNRKPSYDVLRQESSPVEWLQVAGQPGAFAITLRARKTVPAHRMTGYTLRGVLYGYGEIPLERRVVEVPTLAPGEEATIHMHFTEKEPLKIVFDVLRPTAFSAYTHLWRA